MNKFQKGVESEPATQENGQKMENNKPMESAYGVVIIWRHRWSNSGACLKQPSRRDSHVRPLDNTNFRSVRDKRKCQYLVKHCSPRNAASMPKEMVVGQYLYENARADSQIDTVYQGHVARDPGSPVCVVFVSSGRCIASPVHETLAAQENSHPRLSTRFTFWSHGGMLLVQNSMLVPTGMESRDNMFGDGMSQPGSRQIMISRVSSASSYGRRWRGGGKFFIDTIGGGGKVMVIMNMGNGVLRETHSVTCFLLLHLSWPWTGTEYDSYSASISPSTESGAGLNPGSATAGEGLGKYYCDNTTMNMVPCLPMPFLRLDEGNDENVHGFAISEVQMLEP
ncbi:hypothetical protein ARMSODRAFT_983556 [Armillaria solidipes]|uniref:Uncharacterized protein n=1 Tax=Armillaria solidipes TaxID=1076256 RepID=A0A2H3AV87_9AGAR|nr:hypothetical protein ARMSODRAFT_983556 [Armillaria solidipes]